MRSARTGNSGVEVLSSAILAGFAVLLATAGPSGCSTTTRRATPTAPPPVEWIPSITATVSPTATQTGSASRSPTGSRTATRTTTATRTRSHTRTASHTPLPGSTATDTPTPLAPTATCPAGCRYYSAGGSDVIAISSTSFAVVATIPVGTNPTDLAIPPGRTELLVANAGSNSVSVIDRASGAVVATIPVGAIPTFLSVTPDGSRALVANFGSNSVSILDLASRSVLATISVGTGPRRMDVTPNGSLVFVPNSGGATVSVLSLSSFATTATIAVAPDPYWISFTGDGSFAYVAGVGSAGQGTAIDVGTLAVVATFGGMNSLACAASPDGSFAFFTDAWTVGQMASSAVHVATQQVVATFPLPFTWFVAVSPDSAHTCFLDPWGSLHAIDNTNLTVAAQVATGVDPVHATFSGDSARVLVANQGSGTVSIIDSGSWTILATVPVPTPNCVLAEQ